MQQVSSRQTRKIVPAFARLRVHGPNVVPYMEMHCANFPGLSGCLLVVFMALLI